LGSSPVDYFLQRIFSLNFIGYTELPGVDYQKGKKALCHSRRKKTSNLW